MTFDDCTPQSAGGETPDMNQYTFAAFTRIALAGLALCLGLPVAFAQVGSPDLYATPNYAVSKLPIGTCRQSDNTIRPDVQCQKDADCSDAALGNAFGYRPPFVVSAQTFPGGATCTGKAVPASGIQKFVDTLPTLCAFGKNSLGNCIPLAVPDTATFPGNDYYELGVHEYATRFHRDLPSAARQRGYRQINTAATEEANKNYYLGPLILAQAYRPVRMKLVNELPTGLAGELFVPVDTSIPGAGDGPDGTPYTQNRVAVHLHGGNSPWISDGTQHQWTAPAGEATTHKKGLAVAYVPDMWFDIDGKVIPSCAGQMSCGVVGASTNPGDGQLSFYWPNEQSGRLMWYHDHAYGITRLNVMAGMAAGYLLVQADDEDALAAAGVPGTIGTLQFDPAATAQPGKPVPTAADLTHYIPLIIQDKTFVPPQAQLAWYDKTWDAAKWGGEDSVWFPHVYVPNQWLDAPDGSASNPFGRWDYGPFFWPPQQTLTSNDGQPRALTQACTSAAAVSATNPNGDTLCPTTPNPSLVPESFLDTPTINGTAYPTLTVKPERYRFQILNGANDRYWNLSFFVASTDLQAPAPNTEVKMVVANPGFMQNYTNYSGLGSAPPMCNPASPLSQVTGLPVDPVGPCYPARWPTDARQGGAPDPAAAGPRWVQIGTEGGLLPGAAVIPPLPVVYEMNKRNIVVTNIADHSLLLGPAERADVVVDFSQYAGQTLILYSDSPAPVPAGDPRSDYFTWNPDFTDNGGAPTVLPGYGPNTRTLMQVTVEAAASPGYTLGVLNDTEVDRISAALKARFAASQLKPIVPQPEYSDMTFRDGTSAGTITANTFLPISTQSLTFTPVGTNTPVNMPFQWKALHELFSTDYGRMNSVLAVEIPASNWLVQTTIPYNNVDPATEFISDNVPALWKITHNGVDTHTIHFHLMNVQIINRVGWDGQIRAPDANELGWKESVRMNPLEDIYVALQPVKQKLPWPQPDMVRPLDVDRPLGTRTQFTGVDIFNNPINVTNQLFNFGQEYVWHCHLLGHEENDMLRMEVFVVAPEDPSALTAILRAQPGLSVALSWFDNSMSAMSFRLERSTTTAFTNPTVFDVLRPVTQPGPVTFTDPGPLAGNTTYYYRVRAEKVLSSAAIPGATWPEASAWSATVSAAPAPIAQLLPLSSAFGNQTVPVQGGSRAMTLTNVGTATMNVGAFTLVGLNAGDFVIASNGCRATLAVGASCTVNVAFKPLTAGIKGATLQVVTNSLINPTQTVALSGTGLAAQASVSPASLVFSAQAINARSLPRTVVLSNLGGATLNITSVNVTGNFARQNNGVGNCGNSLASGASCNLYVTFTPTTGGSRTGNLVIASNDPVNPSLTVTLSGWGNYNAARGVTVTPANGSGRPGTSVTFTAVGTGAGGGAVYSYRFWFFDGSNWALAQDYSTTATWTWAPPLGQLPGVYGVQVDVRTNPTALLDATTSTNYTLLALRPATGLTLTAAPATPARNTPVVFTGTASGAGGGAVYSYQFWLFNGVSWSLVQDWSVLNTFSWAGSATAGAYTVEVRTRTSPWVLSDVTKQLGYTVP
jgi:FtsP/CotA-like multicopper oxidase with cupredoxin domain